MVVTTTSGVAHISDGKIEQVVICLPSCNGNSGLVAAVTTMTSDHPVPCCPIASTRSPSVYSMYSPFSFLSICLVAPPISEHIVRSVSLYDYLICFLSCFRSLYVPVPFHY